DARAEAGERSDTLPPADHDERDREDDHERPERWKADDLGDRVGAGASGAAERQQDAVARREEAVLVERPPAVPLERDDLAAIERAVELHRKALVFRALVVARLDHPHDVRVDHLDAHAGVGIAARRDRGDGDREDKATKHPQRTCSVAPTLVVRPESSITLKTRL